MVAARAENLILHHGADSIFIAAKDIAGAVAFAKEKGIDFAVVAPDDLPSMIAAFLSGPKQGTPISSRASTIPSSLFHH